MICCITLQPTGNRLYANTGQTLYQVMLEAGVAIEAPCGGYGRCGKCRVLITDAQGVREVSACQYRLQSDVTVKLKDIIQDTTVSVTSCQARGRAYGLAFDVGTTTIVGSLVELERGGIVAVCDRTNSQKNFGADVMARLTVAAEPEGLEQLTQAIQRDLLAIEETVCRYCDLSPQQICQVVCAGNSVMSHLLSKEYPKHLAFAPFGAGPCYPLELPAYSLGLSVSEGAVCHLLPPIGGYVGGDTTAALLAERADLWKELTLFIDIGTNCELVLGSTKLGYLACAAAAGPAFEGGNISCGMRAEPGAVIHVSPTGTTLVAETLGGLPPAGICGSGLIDATAAGLRSGQIDCKGRILTASGQLNLTAQADGTPLYLQQSDIRQVQLAKGAIRAGLERLCQTLQVTPDDIHHILLAGAFGSHIDLVSAMDVGLLPPGGAEKAHVVGNAAGAGAVQAMDQGQRIHAAELASQCRYLPLAGDPVFEHAFIRHLNFEFGPRHVRR